MAHNFAGIITVLGFLAAFALSKLPTYDVYLASANDRAEEDVVRRAGSGMKA